MACSIPAWQKALSRNFGFRAAGIPPAYGDIKALTCSLKHHGVRLLPVWVLKICCLDEKAVYSARTARVEAAFWGMLYYSPVCHCPPRRFERLGDRLLLAGPGMSQERMQTIEHQAEYSHALENFLQHRKDPYICQCDLFIMSVAIHAQNGASGMDRPISVRHHYAQEHAAVTGCNAPRCEVLGGAAV